MIEIELLRIRHDAKGGTYECYETKCSIEPSRIEAIIESSDSDKAKSMIAMQSGMLLYSATPKAAIERQMPRQPVTSDNVTAGSSVQYR